MRNINNQNFLLIYTICLEDPELIQKALKINNDDIVLSITSAGCNILNLLLNQPKKIISIDPFPCQNYLLELKIKAIQNLEYTEFLELMGIIPSNARMEIYNAIKDELNEDTRLYWDSQINLIKKGITYGKYDLEIYEKYFGFLKGKKTIEGFLKCETLREQKEYFFKHMDSVPWRLLQNIRCNTNIRVIYSFYNDIANILKIKKSQDTIFFEQIFKNKAPREGYKTFFRSMQRLKQQKNCVEKAEYVFTNVPVKNNYFASLMLLGYYLNENCYPPYLKKISFQVLKRRVSDIQIQTASLHEFLKEQPDNSISKFNLSNIFDWMKYENFVFLIHEISRVAKNNARFCYFSVLRDRGIPDKIKNIASEKELSNHLLKEDRTQLFPCFEIGEIRK